MANFSWVGTLKAENRHFARPRSRPWGCLESWKLSCGVSRARSWAVSNFRNFETRGAEIWSPQNGQNPTFSKVDHFWLFTKSVPKLPQNQVWWSNSAFSAQRGLDTPFQQKAKKLDFGRKHVAKPWEVACQSSDLLCVLPHVHLSLLFTRKLPWRWRF